MLLCSVSACCGSKKPTLAEKHNNASERLNNSEKNSKSLFEGL